MASHYSCIGFEEDPDAFETILQQVAALATPVRTKRGTYLHWASEVGAELWLQVNREGELIGVNPHFVGLGTMRIGSMTVVARPQDTELDGAFHCWANPTTDEPDSGDYPFVFDSPDFNVHASHLTLPARGMVQLAAFAEEVRLFDSVDAYDRASTEEPRFAVESFVPAGLFRLDRGPEEPPTAHALFTGQVLDGGERKNPLSNRPFFWATVKTLGGTVDVVLAASLAPEGIPVGGVIQGFRVD